MYFTYLSNTQFTDSDKGFVYAQADNDPDSAVTYVNVFDSVTEATLGLVQSGIYYIDGFFSRITPQNIVLSNTTHKPTGQVGFTITSKTVDANDGKFIDRIVEVEFGINVSTDAAVIKPNGIISVYVFPNIKETLQKSK